ncbi:MAG: hypothetical protein ACOZNI_31405 [Myxococcota bacterium]
MWLLALAAPAYARCAVQQTPTEAGVRVVVTAEAEPIRCRTVTVRADAPVEVEGRLVAADGFVTRLRGPYLRALPGGGWEIGAPELAVGGRVELAVTTAGEALTVTVAPAPPVRAEARRAEETRTYLLDAKHPEWGFADRARGRTRVDARYVLAPGALVPLPEGATVRAAEGLAPVEGALKATASEASATWEAPGAAPQGVETIPPGSLTLTSPGVAWVATAGPGVAVEEVEGGVRFVAPEGGEVRWRVASVGGRPVIPDVATFVAGLDARFAAASLPEPAVPFDLKILFRNLGADDRQRAEILLGEVRALVDAALPGAEPLRPRQLNKAWRSGWATSVERGLVLHRMLGQERIAARWVLTGDAPDPRTLTGYDHLLLRALVDGEPVWIDPACRSCAFGEVSTRWLGKPAVGGADEVPGAPGRLERALALAGDQFVATFRATGAAALWLREIAGEVEPAQRGARLADALGLPGGTLVEADGFEERGAPVRVKVTSSASPRDPFAGDTPWSGGWGDALPMDPEPERD